MMFFFIKKKRLNVAQAQYSKLYVTTKVQIFISL